jgi:hypothetical protein
VIALFCITGVSTANYPELMRRCHMVNAPWLFNTVWWVIKGWLAARTIEKINVLGSSYLAELTEEVTLQNLPAEVGGEYSKAVEPFVFDLSHGGLLHSPCLKRTTETSETDEKDK